jgi:hypothetical protein
MLIKLDKTLPPTHTYIRDDDVQQNDKTLFNKLTTYNSGIDQELSL